MAYSAVPTVATGDLWTAANHNTYVRDNFAALWPGTTAGDIDYYSSATAKARLGKPAFDALLKNTAGGVMSWLAESTFLKTLLTKRQGGSATIFATQGTTDYTPTPASIKRYKGVKRISLSSEQVKSAVVTFPDAFTYAPHVMVSSSSFSIMASYNNPTASQVTIYVYCPIGTASGDIDVTWEAEGE